MITRVTTVIPFVFSVALVFGQSQPQATTSLTLDEVVTMLDAKLPEQVILQRIKTNGKAFNLRTDDLVRLKNAGATEKVMVLMMDPTAATASAASVPAAPAAAAPPVAEASPFTEPGVYFKKAGEWTELLPEVVNWKTGGALKSFASAGIVKKDVNGNIPGQHSRNSINSPLEFTIYAPEGIAITEYQLIRLRANPGKDYREFRTVTGGVFNQKSGALRDMVPFEGKKVGSRLYSVILPPSLGAGEYGFICLAGAGGSGGMTSLSMGKMYTFHLLE